MNKKAGRLRDIDAARPEHQRQALQCLRLTADEFAARAALTEDELAALDRIATGHYVRNAAAILRAIEFRAAYAYGRPTERHEHSGEVTFHFVEDETGRA